MSTLTTAPATTRTAPATSRLDRLAQQVHQPTAPVASPASEATAQVLSTTDYSLFKKIDANRPVVEQHVKYLMEQIQEKNLLHLRPIDVNADFGLVDGQHRLEAARRLGVSVYYRVGQLTDDDMAALNRASRNWTGENYLHYWASKGKEDYIALAAFMERFPKIGLTASQTLVGRFDGYKSYEFKDGYYRIGDVERGAEVVLFAEKIREETTFKYALDSRFIMALHHCWAYVKGFDATVLLRKLLLQPTVLVRCATQKQYLELFERIYNYKTTEKLQVRFR